MLLRSLMLASSCALVLVGCGGGTEDRRAVPVTPATNPSGGPVTAIVTAQFDPANGVVPLPNNLLLSGSPDLTLNIPVSDPTDISNPLNALNALDGWGTSTPWNAGTIDGDGSPTAVSPATVVAGSTVRFFEVQRQQAGAGIIGLVRELQPNVDYVAVATAGSIAVSPLQPLDELTTYMAIITNGVQDSAGNELTPSQTYLISKRTTPLIDGQGNSTDQFLDNATAQALEPLRQLVNSQEAVAAAAGVNPDDIVLSWSATTQSITPVLATVRATIQPRESIIVTTGLDTSLFLGGLGAANIFFGATDLPYYLDAPSAENPTAPLTSRWEAAPGAYAPPFDALGLDPTSTNLTFANRIPVIKSIQKVPVLLTLPKTPKPATGYPVTIFQHGITRNRADALALADAMALAGRAVIAIDQPLHGIPPDDSSAFFRIENFPLGELIDERTFDLDLANNETGAPGPDGNPDASGAYTINLSSLLTGRDNNRQASADLMQLTANIGLMDFDNDGTPDFDTSDMAFVGQSLGSIVGTSYLAVEPTVTTATLSVPGGGIVGLLLGSPTFGPQIVGGLAASGVEQGTPDFEAFVFAAQTVIDSADPINWARAASQTNAILLQEVVGSDTSLPDQVIPNSVPGFPLSGTEPLIRTMGLAPITGSTQDPNGIRGVTRFVVGDHGSLLSPASSLDATVEMQTEAVSMSVSGGQAVQVVNPEVLQGN